MVYIYVVECADKSYYTGITSDLVKRFSQHNKGKASYTKDKLPLQLVHLEQRTDRKEAARIERHIKNVGAKNYIIRYKSDYRFFPCYIPHRLTDIIILKCKVIITFVAAL